VSSGAACFVFVECHLSRTRISGVRFVQQSNEGSVSERAGSSRHENHGIISAAAASCRFGSTSPRVVVGDAKGSKIVPTRRTEIMWKRHFWLLRRKATPASPRTQTWNQLADFEQTKGC